MIFYSLNEDVRVRRTTGNCGTLCVSNCGHTTCVWFFSAEPMTKPCAHYFSLFCFNIHVGCLPLYATVGNWRNRLHVSTNRGPSSFAMLSSVWWWSFGVCPRLTCLQTHNTHNKTNVTFTRTLLYDAISSSRQTLQIFISKVVVRSEFTDFPNSLLKFTNLSGTAKQSQT